MYNKLSLFPQPNSFLPEQECLKPMLYYFYQVYLKITFSLNNLFRRIN